MNCHLIGVKCRSEPLCFSARWAPDPGTSDGATLDSVRTCPAWSTATDVHDGGGGLNLSSDDDMEATFALESDVAIPTSPASTINVTVAFTEADLGGGDTTTLVSP